MVDLQTVCSMCGDVGFPDKLFRCSKCHHRFQHSYVLQPSQLYIQQLIRLLILRKRATKRDRSLLISYLTLSSTIELIYSFKRDSRTNHRKKNFTGSVQRLTFFSSSINQFSLQTSVRRLFILIFFPFERPDSCANFMKKNVLLLVWSNGPIFFLDQSNLLYQASP